MTRASDSTHRGACETQDFPERGEGDGGGLEGVSIRAGNTGGGETGVEKEQAPLGETLRIEGRRSAKLGRMQKRLYPKKRQKDIKVKESIGRTQSPNARRTRRR